MKITKSQLKQVILEVLNEEWTGADTSAKNYQDKAERRLLPRVKRHSIPVQQEFWIKSWKVLLND